MSKKPAKTAAKAAGKPKAKPAKNEITGIGGPNRQDQNISIRKIDNGYVTTRSGYRGDRYVSRETFTATKPKIVIGGDK